MRWHTNNIVDYIKSKSVAANLEEFSSTSTSRSSSSVRTRSRYIHSTVYIAGKKALPEARKTVRARGYGNSRAVERWNRGRERENSIEIPLYLSALTHTHTHSPPTSRVGGAAYLSFSHYSRRGVDLYIPRSSGVHT